jgi:hypothetical protein
MSQVLFHLVSVNVMAVLSVQWFRFISCNVPSGTLRTAVAMLISLVALMLIVNAIVVDVVYLAAAQK